MADFFADSFAIIEILKGNPAYHEYGLRNLVTTEFNLCEVAYAMVRDYPDRSLSILSLIRSMIEIVQTGDSDYIAGANVRLRNNRLKRKFSTIDCLGYVVAERLNIPFLTGDREFFEMQNVEFVT